MDLEGLVGDPARHFRGVKLRHRRFGGVPLPPILLHRGLEDEHLGCVDFRGHVRKHELDGLKFRDGMAEGQAFPGILQRGFECALCDSGGLRGNADAAAIERRECYLVAFAFAAYSIRHWNLAIAEDEFAASGGADAEFLFFPADFKSRCAFFHDHGSDSFFAFCGFGVHVDDRGIGCAAIGDPRLGAVQNIVIAVSHSFGL